MSVIALTLREAQAGPVRACWARLEARLGLWGVQRTLFPHVTLLGCDGLDRPSLQAVLEDFSHRLAPFSLRTAGLGVFLRPKPVLHAPVIRTPALSRLHLRLWEEVGRLGGDRYDLYSPERWLPHLSLAVGDLTPDNLLEALAILADMDQELRFEVTNLTLFEWIGPCWEPLERYPLLGTDTPERAPAESETPALGAGRRP